MPDVQSNLAVIEATLRRATGENPALSVKNVQTLLKNHGVIDVDLKAGTAAVVISELTKLIEISAAGEIEGKEPVKTTKLFKALIDLTNQYPEAAQIALKYKQSQGLDNSAPSLEKALLEGTPLKVSEPMQYVRMDSQQKLGKALVSSIS